MPSLNEKVDILYKKVLYGRSISGPYDSVFPNQETIASSPKLRGSDIRLADVPETPPDNSTPDIAVYTGSDVYNEGGVGGTFRLTALETSETIPVSGASGLYRTWRALDTNGDQLGSWIDGTYGLGYNLKVYVGPTVGPIFSGDGANCEQIIVATNSWYFDYDSGTFYIFDDAVTDNSFTNVWETGYAVYIKGYRYTSNAVFNTMAYQDSEDVSITGGSVTGLTDFSLVDGSNNSILAIDDDGITLNISKSVIDDLTVSSGMEVQGNLTVTGDIIQQSGTDVVFADTILTLNVPNNPLNETISSGQAGIEVYRGADSNLDALPSAKLVWDYVNDQWLASYIHEGSPIESRILLQKDIATQAYLLNNSSNTNLVVGGLLTTLSSIAPSGTDAITGTTYTAAFSRFSRVVHVSFTLGSNGVVNGSYNVEHNLNSEKIMVFGYKIVSSAYNPFIPSYSVTDANNISVSVPTNTQGDQYYFVVLG